MKYLLSFAALFGFTEHPTISMQIMFIYGLVYSKLQRASLLSEDYFVSKRGGWEGEPVIFLFETYLPGMVRKGKQEEKTAISAKQWDEPNYEHVDACLG